MINQIDQKEEEGKKILNEVSTGNFKNKRNSFQIHNSSSKKYLRSSVSSSQSEYSHYSRTSKFSKGFEDERNKIKISKCSIYSSDNYEILINNKPKRILKDKEHENNFQIMEIGLRNNIMNIASSLISSNEFDFECKFIVKEYFIFSGLDIE